MDQLLDRLVEDLLIGLCDGQVVWIREGTEASGALRLFLVAGLSCELCCLRLGQGVRPTVRAGT